jgi:hypothetical protein
VSQLGAPLIDADVTQRTAERIEAHLARLAVGHDPLGHLFAIERLARATRAELRAPRARPGQEQRPW